MAKGLAELLFVGGFVWAPRLPQPKRCPFCGSYHWQVSLGDLAKKTSEAGTAAGTHPGLSATSDAPSRQLGGVANE